jgi:hypothetical protein
MSSGRKYPLHPLTKLRKQQVEGATGALAKTVAAREKLEHEREEAERALERSDAAAEKVRLAEQAALESDELRAGDLHHAATWEMGVAHRRNHLADGVATAKSRENGARDAEDTARVELAAREADAKVVDKDEARFHEGVRRADLAKEEEAAAEIASAKPRR